MDGWADLESCQLCEHRCRVNRLAGEIGVCRTTLPAVASAQLHPAPPSSYTVFMAGCNFKCLNCQNWTISCYPDIDCGIRGHVEPGKLAEECVDALASRSARAIAADRIFFSGGAPDIHLPYIEQVVLEARLLDETVKVNFDTNGYLTEKNFGRVLEFADSVTFDIKAVDDEVHRALTGAAVSPILRNAERIGKDHPEKLWEYRVLVIPDVTDQEVPGVCELIASIDPELPVCFLAFRPNHVLDHHPGASEQLMKHCLEVARQKGLRNAHRAGFPGIDGRGSLPDPAIVEFYDSPAAHLAASYARSAGCTTNPRSCVDCELQCSMRSYVPTRVS